MKKILFSLAALALSVSFTSCGGKAEPKEGADTAQAEAPAAEEAPSAALENDDMTVTAPEGWEAKKSAFGFRMENVKSTETFKPVIKVNLSKKTAAEQEDYYTSKTKGFKKGDDVKLGEYTFKTFRNEDSALYYCYAEVEGKGLLEVETAYVAPEKMEELAPVVESIKLK